MKKENTKALSSELSEVYLKKKKNGWHCLRTRANGQGEGAVLKTIQQAVTWILAHDVKDMWAERGADITLDEAVKVLARGASAYYLSGEKQ